jgi:hypothetical protein
MSLDLKDPPKETATSLVSGIFGDLQQLAQQQFQLSRCELKQALRQRAYAAAYLGFGTTCLLLATLVLGLTAAHWLHWMASPPGTDPAWLPLWGCHAVVAVLLAAIGGSLGLIGRARFHTADAFHNPIAEIFRERDQ